MRSTDNSNTPLRFERRTSLPSQWGHRTGIIVFPSHKSQPAGANHFRSKLELHTKYLVFGSVDRHSSPIRTPKNGRRRGRRRVPSPQPWLRGSVALTSPFARDFISCAKSRLFGFAHLSEFSVNPHQVKPAARPPAAAQRQPPCVLSASICTKKAKRIADVCVSEQNLFRAPPIIGLEWNPRHSPLGENI
jgi:hypothetical protein